MLKLTILLLIQITTLLAVSPDWVGNFTIDQICDPKQCCCFTGTLTIVSRSPTFYTLSAGVSGAASYCGTHHILTFRNPHGFTTTIESDGDKFHFKLSPDSKTLSITYEQEDDATCYGSARRA